MTLSPAQVAVLTDALGLARGRPTRDVYNPVSYASVALCEGLTTAGLMYRITRIAGDSIGRHYRVTGKGVRAVCPDARAAIYETKQGLAPVTVFVGRTGRLKMRWDGPDQGRFEQGSMHSVSGGAVRFLEPKTDRSKA